MGHPVTGHSSELDHHRGGQRGQDHLLGQASLHPCRPRHDFGTHLRHDRHFHRRRQFRIRITRNTQGAGPGLVGLFHTSKYKRSPSTRRNPQYRIAQTEASLHQLEAGRLAIIFGTFHGIPDRTFPTGHHRLNASWAHAVSGRNFRGVQYPEPTACSRTHVEPVASSRKRGRQDIGGFRHGREAAAHRGMSRSVLSMNQTQDLFHGLLIKVT